MNRRRTRYADEQAYTGVNHQIPPGRHGPNSSALAAAKTIGGATKAQPPARSASLSTKKLSGLLLGRRQLVTSSDPRFNGFTSVASHPHSESTLVYEGEDGEDGTYHKNRETMKELSLSEQPPVKMVKKYIPTLTGVKIIEVPEEQLKLQIERCNSIRAGMSLSRSPSMTNNMRKSGSRALSLNSLSYVNYKRSPSLTTKTKLSATHKPPVTKTKATTTTATTSPSRKLSVRPVSKTSAPKQPAKPTPRTTSASLGAEKQLHALQQQIAHEKELQRQIEQAQLEYDQLKQERINQQHHLDLMQEEDEDEALAAAETIDNAADATFDYDSTIPDSPEAVVLRKYTENVLTGSPEVYNATTIPESSQVHEGVLHSPESEYREVPTITMSPEPEQPSALAKLLRPTFTDTEETVTQLGELPPPMLGVTGTLSLALLIRLGDSDRKPMKLALKNLSSQYTLQSLGLAVQGLAALQAYLLLETAENTRLNMKLLQNELDSLDPNPAGGFQSLRARSRSPLRPQSYAEPRQRMMNEQPQRAKMSGRSFRQLTSGIPPQAPQHQQNFVQPMAPHPALQPGYQLPLKKKAAQLYARAQKRPHSQFAPNHQRKSSFLREEEGNGDGQVNGGAAPVRASQSTTQPPQQRLTLRGQTPVASGTQHPPASTAQPNRNLLPLSSSAFKSRIMDSDDDDDDYAPAPVPAPSHGSGRGYAPGPPSKKKGGFITNTFILPAVRDQYDQPVAKPAAAVPIAAERKLFAELQGLGKEKKKFGKLRKLFGKNKD